MEEHLHRPGSLDKLEDFSHGTATSREDESKSLIRILVAAWSYQDQGRAMREGTNLEGALVRFLMADRLMWRARAFPSYNILLNTSDRERISRIQEGIEADISRVSSGAEEGILDLGKEHTTDPNTIPHSVTENQTRTDVSTLDPPSTVPRDDEQGPFARGFIDRATVQHDPVFAQSKKSRNKQNPAGYSSQQDDQSFPSLSRPKQPWSITRLTAQSPSFKSTTQGRDNERNTIARSSKIILSSGSSLLSKARGRSDSKAANSPPRSPQWEKTLPVEGSTHFHPPEKVRFWSRPLTTLIRSVERGERSSSLGFVKRKPGPSGAQESSSGLRTPRWHPESKQVLQEGHDHTVQGLVPLQAAPSPSAPQMLFPPNVEDHQAHQQTSTRMATKSPMLPIIRGESPPSLFMPSPPHSLTSNTQSPSRCTILSVPVSLEMTMVSIPSRMASPTGGMFDRGYQESFTNSFSPKDPLPPSQVLKHKPEMFADRDSESPLRKVQSAELEFHKLK